MKTCTACGGAGRVNVSVGPDYSEHIELRPCSACGGSTRVPDSFHIGFWGGYYVRCPSCGRRANYQGGNYDGTHHTQGWFACGASLLD